MHAPADGPRQQTTPVAARTPFAPGAVQLPAPPLTVPGPPAFPRRGLLDRVLLGLAAALAVAAAVAIAASGTRIGVTALAVAVIWVVLTAAGAAIVARFGAGSAVTWIVVTVFLSVGLFGLLADTNGFTGPALSLLVDVGLACLAVSWWVRRQSRLRQYPHSRRRDSARLGMLYERHWLAAEWNVVREALSAPGSKVERMVDMGAPQGSRRWGAQDPLTGRETIRTLEIDVLPGTWVAVDRDGHVTATAPSGAPEAWARVLKEADR
ncbi:hypothetical protein OEB99_02480 [Actinotalea sp. M2MS4P-6]|uniref:hypothetical protein n=1 Tax=Actinotalea sp. M2MS4P-6 TaxID=2983762 RepID=UPI0021E3C71E|nr:hypothetical protein [Actinotalea sp. M2MS4P-6]MCV2393164.1 hypothetical protein [Actinotalea sp. M2MS4P-6]